MRRDEMVRRVRERAATDKPWDIAIVGGGATGMGVAVDAAARGFDVVLLEAHDFGKGTSSRSTKLVHGGVRYLEQGNVPLVMSALKERGLLSRVVLASFLFTFLTARILVIFIMAGKLPPQLFFHVKGTHVHHLNYGIFLLSAVGGILLFARPKGAGWCRRRFFMASGWD